MLEQLKKNVLEVSRLAETKGLCHEGGGNFSEYDQESGYVVITPHAKSRFSLSHDDLVVIDLQGNIIENKSNLKPSSEWPMHLQIYKSNDEIKSVCHTHAPNASVFAALNVPVKPVIFEALMYGGFCDVMPFETPGTIELGESAVKGLEKSDATILGHHGLITVGDDIYEAYLKSLYVEDVCNANIKAASIVGYENVPALSDEQIIYFRDELGLKA